MIYEIFKFEVKYRLKRPETYLFFIFLLLFSIVGVEFIFQGVELGLVKKNSPLVIAKTMGAITGLSMLISSMIMGVPIIRDFNYNIESLIYINPISKKDYYLGRYLGSLLVLLAIFSGVLWGMILGEFMPWLKPDEYTRFHLINYLQPFVWVALPIVTFGASVFFVSGALSKNMMLVYTQGIFVFVLFMLTKAITNETIQALLDPFSLTTLTQITKSWTIVERNSSLIPFSGIMLYNKLLWSSLGFLTLLFGYFKLKMSVISKTRVTKIVRRAKKLSKPSVNLEQAYSNLLLDFGFRATFFQVLNGSFFYVKSILKQKSFWAIVLCSFIILIINSVNLGTEYGVNSQPTTYLIIEELKEMSLYFFLVILLFYSAELMWKEKEKDFHLIHDSTPINNFVDLVSKVLGINFIYILLILTLIIAGIIFQAANGYYQFDLVTYFTGFFFEVFPFLLLYTIVTFFFHTLFSSKYTGIIATLIFMIANIAIMIFGIEHPLLNFGGITLSNYSDMNGYGHSFHPYLSGKLYWFFFVLLLLISASILKSRGSHVNLLKRWKSGSKQIGTSTKRIAASSLILFIVSGFYIYYNTNIINEFWTTSEQEKFRADYEKTLKHLEYKPQPKIVDVILDIELFPKNRSYIAKGKYLLLNSSSEDIHELHVQKLIETHVVLDSLTFDRKIRSDIRFEKFGFLIYTLEEPLIEGDSIEMRFVQSSTPRGFEARLSDSDILYNGSFFDNGIFPSLGYQKKYELNDDRERTELGLDPRSGMATQDDERELVNARSGSDSEGIYLDLTIGTDASQTAVSSGELLGQWNKDGRNYFHYKSKRKIINFYSIVSANYQVKRDLLYLTNGSRKDTIDLEIYYHKGHDYNLVRMMESMKRSLAYYSENFSPYQYEQLRIMEFPRNRKFAQSFPNAIPFSEALGFIMDINDNEDVDMAFYITAHEVAHQWWGMQLEAANVQGRYMILETLAQYSASMILREEYSEEKVRLFLRHEYDEYTEALRRQTTPEVPLYLVEKQKHIYYQKGALNMYEFQSRIGEEKVNLALRNFLNEWRAFDNKRQDRRLATSKDLISHFRAVTPDSLQYAISDLFQKVVAVDKSIFNNPI